MSPLPINHPLLQVGRWLSGLVVSPLGLIALLAIGAVFLGGADVEGAKRWGEGMLAAGKALIELSGDPAKPLGLSIGIAIYRPGSGETIQDLTARADKTMYEVKRAGKGTCRIDAEVVPA